MLAILYLLVFIYFGDCICRYFFRFKSFPHRLATSFLVGLLLSSCVTYLGSLAFSFTSYPIVFGNIIFLVLLILVTFKMPRRPSSSYLDSVSLRPPGNAKWDWICLGVCFVFGCWLMFATLGFQDGNFQFGYKSWSDFGANLSLSQSFALGNNFPTEHPFFPGETTKYHFLFWFQSANMAYLGLNLVWSINLLSLLSLMSLLVLIMTFTELLFNSRIVSRIAAILFFFASSSLSYIPFLWSKTDLSGAISAVFSSTQFLVSGYPFRGEDWGALSVDVFVNQRHLISGVGILFVVMVFLVDFYQHQKSLVKPEPVPSEIDENPIHSDQKEMEETAISPDDNEIEVNDDEILTEASESTMEVSQTLFEVNQSSFENDENTTESAETSTEDSEIVEDDNEVVEDNEISDDADNETLAEDSEIETDNDENITDDETFTTNDDEIPLKNKKRGFSFLKTEDFWTDIQPLLFCGALIGLMPYWNSAIFASALIILGSIFLLFPYRLYMASLLGTAFLVGLPQVLMLKSGNLEETGLSLFHWGYTMPNPTVLLILQYLGWTFGFKWILIIVALWFLPNAHRRFFLAISTLIPVVFLLQLSTDAFNNHKLLNVWGIFASIYAAYALWRIGKASVSSSILAAILALAMVFGAIIDLFPIHNDSTLKIPYENDRLTTWLFDNTKPSNVFLTQNLLTHPILFTGRRIFLANTLFAWTAGYNVGAREAKYKQMFQERNVDELLRLLHENNISYVGIDDGVRRGNNLVKDNLNEEVYQQNFEKVFEDTEHRYDNLIIFKVP